MPDSPTPAVVVDGVSKSFRIPREHVHTLKERALHPLRRSGHDTLHAVNSVSFAVNRGEFFGVVGRNGSGKSTLLKCLAGIYTTDQGRIYVDGRLSTFIELGVGFNPDLAARDNVMLNATMLGLSPREARRRFDEIIAFAELEEFTELKLKNYSSGMMVRLAFSVMVHVDAEILLIDEVLAVGDAAFQQRCYEEFERIRRDGTTVIFVTHDMAAVQRFCDRAILLERGHLVDSGDPREVGLHYLRLNFDEDARAAEAGGDGVAHRPEKGPVRQGSGEAEILDGWFEDEGGRRTTMLEAPERCAWVMRCRFNERVDEPRFGIGITNLQGDVVIALDDRHLDPVGSFEAGQEAEVRMEFPNVLAPGRYDVSPSISKAHSGLDFFDFRERMLSVQVTSFRDTVGLCQVPMRFAVTPVERSAAPR